MASECGGVAYNAHLFDERDFVCQRECACILLKRVSFQRDYNEVKFALFFLALNCIDE